MYALYPSLEGRAVVVTGGGSGIGAAIVSELLSHGAHVASLDVIDGTMSADARLHQFQVDVTDAAAMTAAIQSFAASVGRVDGLVANAANDKRHTVDALTPELWDEVMSVNLKHQFFAAKAVHPFLQKNGGSVVSLGSISWLNGTTGMPAYTTAKAGLHGMVRTLARLWGADGIRVNAVLPGWTMTERQKDLWVDDTAEAEIAANQCLPGHVMPDDIARMVAFLIADDSRMISNQKFIVDGGWI